MSPRDTATRIMSNAKNANFWIGLISGGVGSLCMFATFFFMSGQRLEAHTNAVKVVENISIRNTNSIGNISNNLKEEHEKIAEIKTSIAVIETEQSAQKVDIREIKDAQKDQTRLLQTILLEIKK